ncbi:MAG: hypothetical protein N3A64_00655, partial [Desulfobacterota bacterium]|nr:hypothetical protein [Thermodesulfobacteriota bacterium]
MKPNPFLIAFFFLGAYATTTQVLLIREFLVIFFGNELCLGIIFASWLSPIFIGAILGGKIVNRLQKTLTPFILIQLGLIILPLLQIIFIRSIRIFLQIPSGEYIAFLPMVGSIFSVVFPFGFCIGFIFPFAARSYDEPKKTPAQRIGAVYIYESLGSAIGGSALTFYLLIHYPPLLIIAFYIFLILFNNLFLIRKIRGKLPRYLTLMFWSIATLSFAGLSYFRFWSQTEFATIMNRWKSISSQIEFIESTNSPYQNLVVGKMADQYSLYGNGQVITSFPDPYQAALKAHFILCEHPHPDNVLLIGGGISGIIKEILKHPVKVLHYVELDPTLIKIGLKYLPEEDKVTFCDPRVKIFFTDGRRYVKKCSEQYDLIILNLPDPSTAMLNRFYTLNFFQEIAKILKPNGLFVSSLLSSENFVGEEVGKYAASIYNSLTLVFPYILITPGEYLYFFASRFPQIITSDLDILVARFVARKIETPYFSPYHFRLFFIPERVAFINQAIKNIYLPHPNTDEQPISYFYNLILWDRFTGSKGKGLFSLLHRIPSDYYFSPLIFIIFFGLVYLFRNRSFTSRLTFSSLYAIFAAGFAAMGIEIILLFSYQNHYGYLYQKIGVIVALFMAGLALGAQLINQIIKKSGRNWQKFLLAITATITAGSLFLPYLLNLIFQWDKFWELSEILFIVLVLGAGILTGSEFPLVNEILIKKGVPIGYSAGKVDGWDHFGAALGGLLTGTLLVPLLGIVRSCWFIAGLNLIACLFIIAGALLMQR